jgi:hypothetical protein
MMMMSLSMEKMGTGSHEKGDTWRNEKIEKSMTSTERQQQDRALSTTTHPNGHGDEKRTNVIEHTLPCMLYVS